MKQAADLTPSHHFIASVLSVLLGAAYLLLTALALNASVWLSESRAQPPREQTLKENVNNPVPAPVVPPVVIELFTSQGCSSCPPADKLLGELREEADVIALALHVDYWDYIGWQDPFGDPAYSRRQEAYAKFQRQRQVYTPQMIINGRTDVIGSRRATVAKALEQARRETPETRVTLQADQASISAAEVGDRMVEIWVFAYDRLHETAVAAGENRGRKLADYNVVREMKKLGYWRGEATTLPLNLSSYKEMGRAGVAVVVQEAKGGPILGAAQLKF
tara:strand:+ start:5113 stop:5943 length:831 start_codon:yes stop_codon:yes gene_type:complete